MNIIQIIKLIPGLIRHKFTLRELRKLKVKSQLKELSEYGSELYVFSDRGSNDKRLIYKAFAKILQNNGFAVSFLFYYRGDNNYGYPLNTPLGELSFSLQEVSRCIKIVSRLDKMGAADTTRWSIDETNVFVDGLSFTSEILSTLRVHTKSYDVSINEHLHLVDEMCRSITVLIDYYRMLENISIKHNKVVKIIGWELSYLPNSIFAKLCKMAKNSGGVSSVEFIDFAYGYGNYFGLDRSDAVLSVKNMQIEDTVFRFQVSPNEYLNYTNLLGDRQKKIIFQTEFDTLNRRLGCTKYKVNLPPIPDGKKVYLILPHLFYDAPADDTSSVYPSMTAWFIDTIKFLSEKDNIKIWVKPHPAEFNAINKPKQTVQSLLEEENIVDNVTILEGRDLLSYLPSVNVAVIWRSSAALESSILSTRVVIAGNPMYKHIYKNTPSSIEGYYECLTDDSTLKLFDESISAALYLSIARNYMHHRINWFGLSNGKHKIDQSYYEKYALTGVDYTTNHILYQLQR